jgi:hypothetical protein
MSNAGVEVSTCGPMVYSTESLDLDQYQLP